MLRGRIHSSLRVFLLQAVCLDDVVPTNSSISSAANRQVSNAHSFHFASLPAWENAQRLLRLGYVRYGQEVEHEFRGHMGEIR